MDNIENLVVRGRLGDPEAYARIVARFEAAALAYAFSVLGDYGLAEDARQEAFVEAYLDLASLRDPKAFPGWFRRIVLNQAIRIRRQRRILTIPIEDVPDLALAVDSRPLRDLESREASEEIERALARLPEPEAQAVRLFYIEEKSIREIGEIAGVAAKTVKSRLHAGRARLRRRAMQKAAKSMKTPRNSHRKTLLRDAASHAAIRRFDDEIRRLTHTPTDEDLARAREMLCAKGRLERFLGLYAEAEKTFRGGIGSSALGDDPLFRARLRTETGLTRVQVADYAGARKEFLACRRALLGGPQAPCLLAAAFNGLGMCAWGKGAFPQAREFYEKAREEGRKGACDDIVAEAANNIALLDWKAGRLDQALGSFRSSLARWRKTKNRYAWGLTLMNIGIVQERMGKYASARASYKRALDLARETGFAQVQAAACSNLGSLALAQERYEPALELSARSLEIAREIGDRRSQAIALENAALAHLGAKRLDKAREALADARRIAQAIGDRERLVSLDLVGIELDLAKRNVDSLSERIEKARTELTKGGYVSETPRLLRLEARAELLQGREDRARAILARAMRECEERTNRPEEKRLRALAARLNASAGTKTRMRPR